MASDPLDFSDKYNTPLSPQEQPQYQAWAKAHGYTNNPTYDYDLQGAWKAGAQQAANGHLPDTFKKPNHPTFSDQSQYSGVDGYQGGHWDQQQNGSWNFTPSRSSLKLWDKGDLQNYFNTSGKRKYAHHAVGY